MAIIAIPRVMGGTIMINTSQGAPPAPNAALKVRSGVAVEHVRSGVAGMKVRNP